MSQIKSHTTHPDKWLFFMAAVHEFAIQKTFPQLRKPNLHAKKRSRRGGSQICTQKNAPVAAAAKFNVQKTFPPRRERIFLV